MRKQLKVRREAEKVIPFVQDAEYYFKKGLTAYRRQDLYRAKKYLNRAVQLNEREPIFICQLAVVLSELGEYQEANELFLAIIHELDPEMNECLYFIANNYAHLGLFYEAMKYAEMYMEREPHGEFAEDIEELLELLSIENEDVHVIENQDHLIVKQEKAHSLLEKGKFSEAIVLLEEIIADYPEFWSAYNNLALAYFYIGDVKKAQSLIAEVLKKNPGNLHALCNMLVFHYYLHDREEVARLIGQLQSVYPFLMEHRYKLGAAFALVGRFDLAFKWLHNLYKNGFDGDSAFYYWLSCAAYYTGHKQFAETVWKRAVHLNPEGKGQEPWLGAYSKQAEIMRIHQWLNGEEIAEILYGLYLAGKSLYKDEVIEQLGFQRHLEKGSLIRQFADYFVYQRDETISKDIINGRYIVDMLWERNQLIDEMIYITWFRVFSRVVQSGDSGCNFSNHSAWAAATEYVWSQQCGKKVTQKTVAEKYDISISTVKKYVKAVKAFLFLSHLP